ncbi:MAG TPA: DUF59 domain-containing protein [Thermoplasmata archaeon]|nr:DUF59 domain-containing protein [Thermoplasmata archaeon]
MVTESDVLDAISRPLDPSLGVPLVDLGMIQEVSVVDEHNVIIKVIPPCNCPFLPLILENLYLAAREIPGISEVDIEVLWDSQWVPSLMSKEGRRRLGLDPKDREPTREV